MIKNYLKSREQKTTDLKNYSFEIVKKRHPEFNVPTLPLPSSLTSVAQPLLDRMGQARAQLAENQPVLSNLLAGLSDEQLQALSKTFDKKQKFQSTEDRLVEAA